MIGAFSSPKSDEISRDAPKGESDSELSHPAIDRPGPIGWLVASGLSDSVSRVWLPPIAKLRLPFGSSNASP